MTNEEILDKIKAEIERRIRYATGFRDNVEQEERASFFNGEAVALKHLLSFLSTLEEQAKYKVRNPIFDECVANVDPEVREEVRRNIELEEEYKDYVESDPVYSKLVNRNAGLSIARHFYELGCRRTAEKYDEIEYNRQREELSVLEKECEDFPTTDEEIKQFLTTHPKVELPEKYKTPDWIFEKSEGPVPNDLEEAAEKYASSVEGDYAFSEGPDHYCSGDLVDAYIAGAEDLSEKIAAAYQLGLADKEKQMMKEAMEGEFLYTPYPTIGLDDCKDYNFKDFDKVRVIVLPKED